MEPKSNFDTRTIVVILVSMAVYFGWQQYLANKYPEAMNPQISKTPPLSTLK